MLSRHDIKDSHWARISPLLSGQAGQHGRVGNDNRLFINAIRYLAKTGIVWAESSGSSLGSNNTVTWRHETIRRRRTSSASSRAHRLRPCSHLQPESPGFNQ